MDKRKPKRRPWDEPDAEEVLDDVKSFATLFDAKVRSAEVREEWAKLHVQLEKKLKALEAVEDELESLREKLDDAEDRLENAQLDKDFFFNELCKRLNKMFGFERWDDPMPLYELRRAVEDLKREVH